MFAYIRPCPELCYVLDALRDSGANVLAVVPGASRETISAYASERFQLFAEQLKLGPLLMDMDLAITHGGHGLAGALLIQGVPILALPTNIEQWMLSNQLVRLGIGKQLLLNRVQPDFADTLMRMVSTTTFKDKVKSFAKRYSSYNPEQQIVRIANTIERLPAKHKIKLVTTSHDKTLH